MATAQAMTAMEQYLKTAYSPDADFVDGEIEERKLGEREHARLQALISAVFVEQEVQLDVVSCTEQRVLVAGERVRICDFTLLRSDAPFETVVITPPLLCIEIMSPEDRLSHATKVLEDYRAMGVPHIWLIDPQERLAYTFGSGGLQQQEDLILRAPGTDIAFDVNTLFANLDRKKNKGAA